MYLYIYDSFLKDKKYKHLINRIENRIIDLDIKGKTLHLNLLKNIDEFIKAQLTQGAHTVVIIGNDRTFSSALNSVVPKNIVVAYIPVVNKSLFGQMFGIPSGELACNILSGRIIKELDVGQINKKYFIHSLKIEKAEDVIIKIDNFKIKANSGNQITIRNFNSQFIDSKLKTDFSSGVVNLFIEKQGNIFHRNDKHTTISSKAIDIIAKNDSVPIMIDDYQIVNTPAKISIAKEKLKIIVGSNRQF